MSLVRHAMNAADARVGGTSVADAAARSQRPESTPPYLFERSRLTTKTSPIAPPADLTNASFSCGKNALFDEKGRFRKWRGSCYCTRQRYQFSRDLTGGSMNQADTAWMLVSTALVLLMTPALAFFYGGLVRSKNALNTMMMSFISLGFVGIAWALIGYSLAFSNGNSWIGDMSNALLNDVGLGPAPRATNIPHTLYMCYQGTFCIITAALISDSLVERL